MNEQAWIIVADDVRIGSLVAAARPLGDQVVALVVGHRCVADAVATAGVDRVIWLGEPGDDIPVEAYAGEVARLVAAAVPRVVIGPATDAGRVLLGAVAARLQTPVLAGVLAIALEDERVVVERAVHGGIVQRLG